MPGSSPGKVRRVTRRSVLTAGLGLAEFIKCAHASALARAPAWPHALTYCADEPQANPNKISQAAAQYQPTPKGMFSCAVCTFFIKPRSCKVVDGEVNPAGWCKLFDMVD